MFRANNTVRLTVSAADKRKRLDRWLASELSELSRSQIVRLLEEGAITVDGMVARKAGLKLLEGQEIVLSLPDLPSVNPVAERIGLDILYEDGNVAVINKPAGMVVHPAPGHHRGTLVNALLARYPDLVDSEQPERPGIVHRLDRDTSGVLIVGLTMEARAFLQKQFHQRDTEKEYIALVLGHPETTRGTIEGAIGRHRTHRHKRAVIAEGRSALTHYETLEIFEESTLLLVKPVTGRTHQIRVHLEAIGLPVVGDELYAPRRQPLSVSSLKRHFLHAARLTIKIPRGEGTLFGSIAKKGPERRTFEAPLPAELAQLLEHLR